MLKFFSDIETLPIVSVSTGQTIASVVDFLFDYTTGRVLALIVEPKEFFRLRKKDMLVVSDDILEWSNAIYVQDRSVIMKIDEIVRLKRIYDSYFTIFGLKVRTESGKRIGRLEDFIFETRSMRLYKILVKRGFWFFKYQQLISHKHIVSIEDNYIIVKDDEVKSKAGRHAPHPA